MRPVTIVICAPAVRARVTASSTRGWTTRSAPTSVPSRSSATRRMRVEDTIETTVFAYGVRPALSRSGGSVSTHGNPLIRAVGLRAAVAINVISMIGIGPLITIPLVLGALHGPLSLVGWMLGAGLALCDGLVWAELGSRYPGSGGTYGYLREMFGRRRLGRFLAFLFVWQTIFSAPLLQATGYIGFANYAGYLVPRLAARRRRPKRWRSASAS